MAVVGAVAPDPAGCFAIDECHFHRLQLAIAFVSGKSAVLDIAAGDARRLSDPQFIDDARLWLGDVMRSIVGLFIILFELPAF